jgi:3-dehydroquinate dehydratase/shikimate dehydrogenase
LKEYGVAKLCLCLTAKTLERDLEILDKYRKYADIAELRVDCLDPDERFLIRRFPERAGIPVILTIRRDIDGGHFAGGEGARISLLSKGLAFADADRRRNFAYVDLEEDLKVPSLEEAARTFGTRIIRSYHNIHGVDEDLVSRLRNLSLAGDELVKVAVTPQSTEDVLRVFRAAGETKDLDKILICMGSLGAASRILAAKIGSFLSYVSAVEEQDIPVAAPGQLDIKELSELYRFRSIGPDTTVYGVVGYPLKATGSPLFFNTIFGLESIDAVYLPFPADTLDSFMSLAEEIGLSGFSVTVPYKETILPYLAQKSPVVKAIGACNTAVRVAGGWFGTNTDTAGFSDSLLEFTGKKNLRGQKITIIGAGGAARAVASEVHRLGGKALVLNRTILRARELALPYKFLWGGLDNYGVEMMDKYSDIIIQTSSLGMEGKEPGDPLAAYIFSGREAVMDLIYQPHVTPFLKRAAAAGCRTINGFDMLIRQARYQYTEFMGREFPARLMSRVRFGQR